MNQEVKYTNELYKTHNGKITVENPETGGHRTFQIKTQNTKSRFAPGRRIAHLLTGSDNEHDYTGFGFANDDTIKIWRKKQGKTFDAYASMISNPERWEKRGLIYHFEGTCRICNRTLTTPQSIQSGIGPVCKRKIHA